MDQKVQYIRNLIYFAVADHHFDVAEQAYIRSVGKRIGLDDDIIEQLMAETADIQLVIPDDAVQRYLLFDDVLNVITADHQLHAGEIQEAKKIAKQLGFESAMVDEVVAKLQEHIQAGFDRNRLSGTVKESMYFLVKGNKHYGTFNR